MILTIDIGNSNIVLGGIKGDQIGFEARLRKDLAALYRDNKRK